MKRNKTVSLITFAIALLLCSSCRTTHRTIATEEQEQDSVHIEVRTNTVYVKDTVYLEIPPQTAERTTADSTSHLENDYAESDARINPDGTLYHDLRTKPQEIPKEIETPVERNDSTVYKYKDRTVYETVEVEVERELTWWQQTQIYGFWGMFFVVLFICRKNIFAIVKRLIL